ESSNFKSIIVDIHNSIKEGLEFSAALNKYPKIFSNLYIAIVRTGEDTGSLDASLLRVADYRAKQEEVLSRFRMALVYPVLMGIVGVATVIFMLVFVMPRLTGIFSSMGQNLPLPTQLLIAISEGLRRWWFWIVIILTAFVLTVARFVKTKSGKAHMSLIQLHFPVFGKFILKAELARFSRTLELLLKSGIDALSAIHVSIPVLDNEVLKGVIDKSCKELEHGGSFGRSLKSSKLIPAFMSNLIIVGEESGRLQESLAEVATSYERDTEEQMRVMFSLLEPLMILVIGLIVGFIVVAMLLPVFEINVMAR
ncbi:MAG TPA: type II secretion system protein GspF, partial [Candidatus Omnitrophica bacterium]|nr:type II secretion system protein GspF [Candidatus Omnitrophota bacterium]